MHGCSYVTLFGLKSANISCKDIIRANTKAHTSDIANQNIMLCPYFLFPCYQRVKSEGAQRPPFHLPSLSPMRRNQSCSHSPPTHNHTWFCGEIYCQYFSQAQRVLEIIIGQDELVVFILFSYWCVGLYQWGGRTDKDNDKVKINGKVFVFLTMGVNVDFSKLKIKSVREIPHI